MTRNCKVCCHYGYEKVGYEKVGDSDYGAVYAIEPSCLQGRDYDEVNDCYIESFDREIERDCCVLDIFKVAEIDKEIEDLLYAIGPDEHAIIDTAYKKFKEKYGIA